MLRLRLISPCRANHFFSWCNLANLYVIPSHGSLIFGLKTELRHCTFNLLSKIKTQEFKDVRHFFGDIRKSYEVFPMPRTASPISSSLVASRWASTKKSVASMPKCCNQQPMFGAGIYKQPAPGWCMTPTVWSCLGHLALVFNWVSFKDCATW